VKNVRVIFEDHEFERLVRLKGSKSWREFILSLADFRERVEKESDYVAKDSLKEPYINMAKALSDIGKLMMQEEDGFRLNANFYLASLLPLLVSGVELDQKDLIDLYILVTNLVFEHLKKKYRDDDKRFVTFEYLRIAIIRELKGDTATFKRFLKEVCKGLDALG